ncbi:MAG: flagellar assembly protein FliW [Candidatus Omnitrophica bacterium]|nr:flagellar assembly protein FliW [Candidatus Omnitrophota bacterium]
MKIKTTRFGEIEVDQGKIIHFPEGIIGFQDIKNYLLIGKKERMVMWLQAIDKPEIAFIVVNPFLFEPTYDPKLSRQDLEFLKVTDVADINVLSIVVVPKNPQEMTANLLGPIVVNTKAKLGRQVILTEGNYSVKHPVVAFGVAQRKQTEQMVS